MEPNPKNFSPNPEFEFEALTSAVHYRHALLDEFRAYLTGEVAEIGAGIGQMAELVPSLAAVKKLVAVEPDPRFAAEFKRRLPDFDLRRCHAETLVGSENFTAIFSVNVLEHIEDDLNELKTWKRLLDDQKGHLCLLVPAAPELYAPIDSDFGHFRRYTRRGLLKLLREAGFEVERCGYFNMAGYFAWLLNFRLLRRRVFDSRKVRMFDKWIFPWALRFEKLIGISPFGQSVVAVAKVG